SLPLSSGSTENSYPSLHDALPIYPPGTRRGSPQRRFLQILPIDPTRNKESRGRRLPAGRRRHPRWSSSLESLCGVGRGCGKAPCAPPQPRVRRRLLGPRRRPNLRLQTVLPVLSCLLPYDFLESRAEFNSLWIARMPLARGRTPWVEAP